METTHPPPPPGTGHPGYGAKDTEAIRWWLDQTTQNHLMMGRDGLAVVYACETQVEAETATALPLYAGTRMLHRVFAVTPAPWAERPYAYVYAVAIDDLDRFVASETVEPAWLDTVPSDDWSTIVSVLFGHDA